MVGSHLKPPSSATTTNSIKFLCSYGGKILPRYPDGKLRYHGGEIRVLAVQRSISFSELLVKMGELCGAAGCSLRCQLPKEDLDALVSITSDEDLANLIEEYDREGTTQPTSLKIRAFISPPKNSKISISPLSASSSSKSSSSSNISGATVASSSTSHSTPRCYHHHQISPKQVAYPVKKVPLPYANYHGIPGHVYLVHNGNHWQ